MTLSLGQEYSLPGFSTGASLTICHIEDSPLGPVVHVRLDGLGIPHPLSPDVLISSIPHLAFSPAALHESIGDLIHAWETPHGWEEACQEWRLAFSLGEACIWELPVFDVLQIHQSLIAHSG